MLFGYMTIECIAVSVSYITPHVHNKVSMWWLQAMEVIWYSLNLTTFQKSFQPIFQYDMCIKHFNEISELLPGSVCASLQVLDMEIKFPFTISSHK